jgi:hypothetical protein
MSSPTERSWQALKRVCRYFAGAPRLVYTYPQQEIENVDVYTDTDWAGCPKTRKSTSGGCVMLGSHAIKHWSSTQSSVALSSGEAEFAGVIRGSGQGLGYQALLRDFGVDVSLRVWTDSSAAIGICNRQGLGKLRHLDTHTLWIQQAVRLGRVDLRKVAGEVNPADLFTKHSLSKLRVEQLVELHGCRFLTGRAESAPLARTGASNKVTMASGGGGEVSAVAGKQLYASTSEDPSGANPLAPVMPHLSLSAVDLDRLYPRIRAPADDKLEDLEDDRRDAILQSGMRIASGIRTAMLTAGRTRRRDPVGLLETSLLCVDGHMQASSSHGLPYDVPGTPEGTSNRHQRRLRERGVITEPCHDHDYDNHHDHDDHDDLQTCGHLWSAGSPPAASIEARPMLCKYGPAVGAPGMQLYASAEERCFDVERPPVSGGVLDIRSIPTDVTAADATDAAPTSSSKFRRANRKSLARSDSDSGEMSSRCHSGSPIRWNSVDTLSALVSRVPICISDQAVSLHICNCNPINNSV